MAEVRPCIAVIDDDRDYLELIREVLGAEGYEVSLCEQICDGYTHVMQHRPD